MIVVIALVCLLAGLAGLMFGPERRASWFGIATVTAAPVFLTALAEWITR